MGDHEDAKMRKGLWSPDEDEKLRRCIAMYKKGSWSDIAKRSGLQRCGKSCRRRWVNHLRPGLKRGRFTPLEIKLVLDLHRTLGNRWSEIAGHLVGRTDNDVKNLWNTQIKRRLNHLPSHHQSLSVDFQKLLHKPSVSTNQHEVPLDAARSNKPIKRLQEWSSDNVGFHNAHVLQPHHACMKGVEASAAPISNTPHAVGQQKGPTFTPSCTAAPLATSNTASDASTGLGCSDSGPLGSSPIYNELPPYYTTIGATPRQVEVAEICSFAHPKEYVQLEDWFLPLLSDVDVLTSSDEHGPLF